MRGRGAAIAAALILATGAAAAQTLTIGRERDAPSYDPHKSVAITTAEAMFAMGDTLVALDWDMKTVQPLLANRGASVPTASSTPSSCART